MRVSLLVLITFIGLAMPGLAASQAQSNEPPIGQLRVMVWLQAETQEVLDRIRGQASDLSAELIVNDLEPMQPDASAQLKSAYVLSARQNASLVIWFAKQHAERHFTVYIAIPKTHRLLVRDLGRYDSDGGGDGLSSAVKESAALIVRAAIQAVLSGSAVGEENPIHFDEGSPHPPAASAAAAVTRHRQDWRDTTVQSVPVAPQRGLAGKPELPWSVGLELRMQYDGVGNDHGFAECVLLRAERLMQPLNAFAGGSVCLPRDIDRPGYGTVRIARQQSLVGADYLLWHTWFQASLGVQAGVAFYERRSLHVFGTSEPPRTHVIGTIGPQFRVLAPARGSRIQAGVVLGLDFLPRTLAIGYVVDQQYSSTTRIGVAEPYVAVGLSLGL